MQPHEQIGRALAAAKDAGRTGLIPFITAGYPKAETFLDVLDAVSTVGDVVEIGVPFSDPMADGMTALKLCSDKERRHAALDIRPARDRP